MVFHEINSRKSLFCGHNWANFAEGERERKRGMEGKTTLLTLMQHSFIKIKQSANLINSYVRNFAKRFQLPVILLMRITKLLHH